MSIGATAFIRNHYGLGITYSLGLSFSDSTPGMALGQNYEAEPKWANVFAPAGDPDAWCLPLLVA